MTERIKQWASTMEGHKTDSIRLAHASDRASVGEFEPLVRQAREELEADQLASEATRAIGAGNRATEEEPDPLRTCFERDRDRILHSTAFRRLAGKTQVFIFPDDHQRTRLTHALEVAQVAVGVAKYLRLNETLTEAIAWGHDCGHGAGGHASEDALGPFLSGGFDHAVWGADVVLAPLNLCAETLDGIRNHSWSRPSPMTPEAVVVSWADRIAYVCHDLEDAVSAGIVTYDMVPSIVKEVCGTTRSSQLHTFIKGMQKAAEISGQIGMMEEPAEALAALRSFNYEHIYLRKASVDQSKMVIDVFRGLVEYYADRPNLIPDVTNIESGTSEAVRLAVTYVGGMTDRYAFRMAVSHLGWDSARIPEGV